MTVLLAVAYAAVAALLLNLGLASRWSLPIKFTAVVAVSALYVGTYVGLRSVEGWPTTDPVPNAFRLHWVTVDEPDKQSGRDGAIFLWLRELDDLGRPAGRPRAHALSWDEATARIVREALESLEEGKPINGTFRLGASDGEIPAFETSDVPPPDLPAKPPR